MKHKLLLTLIAGCGLANAPLQAGQPVSEPVDKKVVVTEKSSWFPTDPYLHLLTVGGLFSESLSGVYVDNILGIYATQQRDLFFFMDSNYHGEDNGQFLSSTGLGVRKMLPDQKVIIGGNVYYDDIASERDNNYRQLGLGLEVLTQWVDFRFNYYLPDGEEYEVDRFNKRSQTFSRSGGTVTETNRLRSFKTYETSLEGFNTELGFLVPGVDKYMEVRVFGGYHHYNNPYGQDYEGFHGRLEARLLRGVIADLEYWDDTALMGGHWTAGLRVSLPFSFANLILRGRNPIEGWEEQFKPGPRPFEERMGEMVMRSHRIRTVTSDGVEVRNTTERFTRGAAVGSPGTPPLGVPLE